MSYKVALRYSVIQFMPYVETGEFANVGVMAVCPKTGYFDYKITSKYGRLTQFFPNLSAKQYKASIAFFENELKQIKEMFLDRKIDEAMARNIFDTLTREREAIVRTTETRVRMTNHEETALEELFDYYIAQSFTQDSNEDRLTNRVTQMVKGFSLIRPFIAERIGNDEFHASFPLVQKNAQKQPGKIIKPIYFGQEEANKIYEKSDRWLSRIDRLRRFEFLSRDAQILFAFEAPNSASPSQSRALKTVLADIGSHNIQTINYLDDERIKAFSIY